MRRLFWILVGALAAVFVMRKVSKVAATFSPEGSSSLGDGLREMAAAVREGMAERENELRAALGVDAGTLDPEQAQALLENPTAPRDH